MNCPHCDEMKAEIEYLRSELALDRDEDALSALRLAFGLTAQQAEILQLLYVRAGRVVPKGLLDSRSSCRGDDRATMKGLEVQISRLRRTLGYTAIVTSWGEGYALTAEGKALIDQHTQQKAA